ncbi:MAG: hypothetical protein HQK76_17675, partial [Desulfobacterales bacterium]|nr:hypothetical protein [Desulfobacterales bacterium]
PNGTFASKSNVSIYAIPSIGFSVPVDFISSKMRFGLSAYGVSENIKI